jgi:lactose/L-arabinose transport system permease protein
VSSTVQPPRSRARRIAWPRWGIRTVLYLVAFGGAIAFALPLYWTLIWGTWDNAGIFSYPPKFAPGTLLGTNLSGLQASVGVLRVTFNSVVVAALSTAGALFFSSLAGFAFAKYHFRGRTILFYLMLTTLAFPGQITYVPLFIIMSNLNWLNTYQALIVPFLVPALGVFLMRQSIEAGVPDEMLESARMDGASELRIFVQIVWPTLLPSLAALAILLFASRWNDLFWPLVVARTNDMYTLPVALTTLIGQMYQPYGQLMVGSAIATIPPLVLFLSLQRYFIQGITLGAIK